LAQFQLAQELGVPADLVDIDTVTEWDWHDSCLGVIAWQKNCLEQSTPGFLVILKIGGQKFEYRTDETGQVIIRIDYSGKYKI